MTLWSKTKLSQQISDQTNSQVTFVIPRYSNPH